jgi:hypothetical protein
VLILLAKKMQEILNWISPGDFDARHSKIRETHSEGTGMWLLDELQSWFEGTGPQLVICEGAGMCFSATFLTFSRRWEDLFDVRIQLGEGHSNSILDTK